MEKLPIETLYKLIDKMIPIIKPNGVSKIEYKLEPGYDWFYMSIHYIVPDDSEFLRTNNRMRMDLMRIDWNNEIRRTIENYFNVYIRVSSSGIRSESYYKSQKGL